MIKSPIIIPKATKGWVSRTSVLGTSTYDLTNLHSPDTALDKSLVLDLASPKFEPNKTYAFDRSSYGNHGTITGATWVREPSGLWVNSFDGTDDYITIPTIALNNTWTIDLWMQINDDGLNSICGDNNATYGFLLLIDSSKNLNFEPSSADNKGVSLDYSGYGSIIGSNYSKLTIVMNTPTLYVYHNGNLIASGDTTEAITDLNLILIARGFTGVAGSDFLGKMELFRVYNTALSLATITNSFNRERHLFGV